MTSRNATESPYGQDLTLPKVTACPNHTPDNPVGVESRVGGAPRDSSPPPTGSQTNRKDNEP